MESQHAGFFEGCGVTYVKNKSIAVGFFVAASTFGALAQNTPRADPNAPTPTPECHCQDQCAAMWAAAPDAIEAASHMRLRLATDTLVDTYAPTDIGYMHGRAIKTPAIGGGFRFVADFDSRPALPDSYKTALELFNLKLSSAGLGMCSSVTN